VYHINDTGAGIAVGVVFICLPMWIPDWFAGVVPFLGVFSWFGGAIGTRMLCERNAKIPLAQWMAHFERALSKRLSLILNLSGNTANAR
jgi:hypothetical protein